MSVTKILTGRDVAEGHRIPFWLGVSYWRWDRDEAVCHPIPLNWLVRWARQIYFVLKIPRPTQREQMLNQARQQGFEDGLAAGWDQLASLYEKRLRESLPNSEPFHIPRRHEVFGA